MSQHYSQHAESAHPRGRKKRSVPSNGKRKRKGLKFLDLPVELWSHICELIVVETLPIKVFSKLGSKTNEKIVMQPGISCTCRLLRKETLPMFYERNTFMAYDQIAMPGQLVSWIAAIGWTNRALLRRLYVRGTDGKIISRIDECCIDAGITLPIRRMHIDGFDGRHVHHLSFVEPQTSDNEERLQEALNLLRISH